MQNLRNELIELLKLMEEEDSFFESASDLIKEMVFKYDDGNANKKDIVRILILLEEIKEAPIDMYKH